MPSELSAFERRVLAYLDQRGASHRRDLAADLSPSDSRTARFQNGSNGAVPMLVASWCRRLKANGFVRENREYLTNFYISHEITSAGRSALRETSNAK